MSLRSDESRALRKALKSLQRCRRDVGTGAFAVEQAGLHRASTNLRSLTKAVAVREELFEAWLKQEKLSRLRRT